MSGRTPNDSTSRNSATSTANSAGCAYPVWSSSPASVAEHHVPQRRVQEAVQVGAHLVQRVAKTGKASYNSRPMPTR